MFKPLGGGRGILCLNGKEISTPTFVVSTIRGAVPHLTPDNYPKVPIAGIFTQDFIDQHGFASEATKQLPINTEISLISVRPPDAPLLQKPNTDDTLGLASFQGTQLISIDSLAQFSNQLGRGSSIIVSPHDTPNQPGPPGKNRARKMEKRSSNWLNKIMANKPKESMVLASITPELVNQEYLAAADGIYATDKTLQVEVGKLRVCGTKLSLSEIGKLVGHFDVFYPNIDDLTNNGLALLDEDTSIDLHDPKYKVDMRELGHTGYSLAYIHHLLDAREMTASVLLQKHNLAVVADFFARLSQQPAS